MQDAPLEEKDYTKFLEEKLVYLKKVYPLDDRNNWIFQDEKDEVTTYSMYDRPTGLKIIRGEGLIKATRKKLVEIAEAVTPALEWDDSLEDIKLLTQTKDYYIFYALIKKKPLVVQREVILLAKFFYEDDGTVYAVAGSISSHPNIEDTIYKVRAKTYLLGWVLKPSPRNSEHTYCTMILHGSPEGWIPKPLFNWFSQTQAFNVLRLRNYAERQNNQKERKEEENREVDCTEI